MSSEPEVFLVEYIDHRPIVLKEGLSKYKAPVQLPGKDPEKNTLKVTASERESLLAWRNGDQPCFRDKTLA